MKEKREQLQVPQVVVLQIVVPEEIWSVFFREFQSMPQKTTGRTLEPLSYTWNIQQAADTDQCSIQDRSYKISHNNISGSCATIIAH